VLAVGSLLLAPTAVGTALADETDPVVAVLAPASAVADAITPVVDGPFDMVVEVTGGVPQDLTVTPRLPSWGASTPAAEPITIAAGSCPDVCRVSWRIDPGAQLAPWYTGMAHLDVLADMGGRSIQTYGNAVTYQPVVQSTWVTEAVASPTVNTMGNAPSVFDTGGSVRYGGMQGRSGDEQVRVTVLPSEGDLGAPPLVSATGSWEQDPDPQTPYAAGRVDIDTSSLPEGSYRLVAQPHDSAGHWSYATAGSIIVVHSPPVTARVDGPGIVATGRPIDVSVSVRGLRYPDPRPGTTRVTIGGTAHVYPAASYDWYVPGDTTQPSGRWVSVPTAGLPLGRAVADVEVLDVGGKTIGSASTSFTVVDFQERLTVPTLVVGRSASVRLQATAPSGTSLLECFVYLQDPLKQDLAYQLCPGPRATSVDRAAVFVPQNAGTGVLRAEILANDGVIGPQRDVPVTVYANRTAAVTAPTQAAWGTTQTATVTVLDEKRVGVRSPAAALTVTLQRKNTGTSTWTSIGSAVTGSTGVATVRYTNSASGRLRTLVKGAVPGSTVTSAERSTTSVAVVAWSSLPTSTRSGAVVTAAVYAKPYEQGATVRFQARRLGAAAWTTFGSGTIGSSGYAKATARLWSRGTWEVRIQRIGTTTQATGYSTVRRTTVS